MLADPLEQWLPWCLDGRRSAPPEDAGGTGGYEELLEVLADPSDEAHAAIAGCDLISGIDPAPATSTGLRAETASKSNFFTGLEFSDLLKRDEQ